METPLQDQAQEPAAAETPDQRPRARTHKYWPFVWIAEHDLFQMRRAKRKPLWLGICGYSKRVAQVTRNWLTPLIVGDTIISEQHGCEEARRCWDFDCPLNRTTWESMQAAHPRQRVLGKRPPGFGQTIVPNRDPAGGLRSFAHLVDGVRAGVILQRTRD